MLSSRNARSVVGLEIEPSYLAAAEVRPGGPMAIQRAAATSLDAGIVRDGEVLDVEGLGSALKTFFSEHKLGRRVRLGVANQRIVVRMLDLPPLGSAKELDAAVRFQAQDQIPMPLDQAVLDYQSLGTLNTPEGERTRVVLVAARRDTVEKLLAATRAAGLRPEGIDLSAFAMVRALHEPSFDDTRGVMYVSVGGMTNIAVAVGTRCLFTRVVPGGLEALAAALAERRELTLDHARLWLAHVGLERPVEEVEGDPDIVSETRNVLVGGVARVADEVRNSLNFYRTQGAPPVAHAVLTGPAAAVPGFAAELASELRLEVQRGVVAEAQPGSVDARELGRVAVAAGLAVTETVTVS